MKLKDKPEDFYVEEAMDLNLKPKGNYAYFILEKKNWTTLKAIEFIADKLHINVKRFAFAGQKDRYAITRQYVSAYKVSDKMLRNVKLKDIYLEFLGYGDKPIALGQLAGNKFRIVARELDKPLHHTEYAVNYYDDQRFGGYRPNLHKIGKEVLLGNYEDAVKLFLLYPFPDETSDYVKARKTMEEKWGEWDRHIYPKHLIMERKIVGYLEKSPQDFKGALKSLPRNLFTMITQAYQSYIFNESLARYIKRKYPNYREVEYSVGTMVFIDEYFEQEWPIVGYETKISGEIKDAVEEVLKEENIWYETFNCEIPALSSKGLTRPAMIQIKGLKIGSFDKGVQHIRFFLPKGSYATVVLKSLE